MKSSIVSILILPNIRSAVNVGAIFRTAEAVGIDKIYLTGYTPKPTDKFGRIQKDIKKSALGAEELIPWEYKKSLLPLISELKKKKYKIIAIEQDKKAVDYRTLRLGSTSFDKTQNKSLTTSHSGQGKYAFILGEEVNGLDKKILDKCDLIAEIPMYGKKESLNVSVACGVALFRILK